MTQLLSIKLFTGAPEAHALQWDNEALTAPLLPCFAPGSLSTEQHAVFQADTRPVWRSLPLHSIIDPVGGNIPPEEAPRPTASTAGDSFDHTSPAIPATQDLSFASTTGSPAAEPADAQTQFYEHSFALHEAAPSSQLLSAHSSAHTSFLSISSTSSPSPTPTLHIPPPVPSKLPLTALHALPSAPQILSLHPLTPTVNLLLCILSIPPPRLIHPRRGGPPLLLTELLVADDTRAGFGLNIWLPLSDAAQSPRLRTAMGALRVRDVVLARNVALGAFRGVVYGQSLRRDATRLELMFRAGGGGVYSARELESGGVKGMVVERVRAVRRWVMEFVGGGCMEGDRGEGSPGKSIRDAVMLPPDTQ